MPLRLDRCGWDSRRRPPWGRFGQALRCSSGCWSWPARSCRCGLTTF